MAVSNNTRLQIQINKDLLAHSSQRHGQGQAHPNVALIIRQVSAVAAISRSMDLQWDCIRPRNLLKRSKYLLIKKVAFCPSRIFSLPKGNLAQLLKQLISLTVCTIMARTITSQWSLTMRCMSCQSTTGSSRNFWVRSAKKSLTIYACSRRKCNHNRLSWWKSTRSAKTRLQDLSITRQRVTGAVKACMITRTKRASNTVTTEKQTPLHS